MNKPLNPNWQTSLGVDKQVSFEKIRLLNCLLEYGLQVVYTWREQFFRLKKCTFHQNTTLKFQSYLIRLFKLHWFYSVQALKDNMT